LGNWQERSFTPVGGSVSTDDRNHNKLNEITQRTINSDTPIAFSYDGSSGASNGNLTNDGTLIYAYDALNRLIQVNRVSDGAVIANYSYDALNRRIMRAVSNGGLSGDLPTETLYQAWFGQRLMQERRSSDNDRTRYYLWGNYINELIQIQYFIATGSSSLPAGDYYPLQDNLYRTMALTDYEGNIVEAYDMDAYGNTLTFTSPGTAGNWWADNATQSDLIGNRIIYCGYMYDPETQLYYVRNRHYNPNLGRWVQRDPIGYHGGINLYEYVGSRPMFFCDPMGLQDPGFFGFGPGGNTPTIPAWEYQQQQPPPPPQPSPPQQSNGSEGWCLFDIVALVPELIVLNHAVAMLIIASAGPDEFAPEISIPAQLAIIGGALLAAGSDVSAMKQDCVGCNVSAATQSQAKGLIQQYDNDQSRIDRAKDAIVHFMKVVPKE
jgi:RHS repeat-associated protein